ncbi:MAG TPA: tRNA preQ1(34) S-adenosylmethionine ribosyltransferase-isomerase QueA [Thermosynechococcaceae cyanobacterium]
MNVDRSLSAYNYVLPEEQIAQTPAQPRDSARLLVVQDQEQHAHSVFRELPDWLRPGDLLILNNTRVIPARLYGRKASGLRVEILLLEPRSLTSWLALVKPGRRLKPGTEIFFEKKGIPEKLSLKATILATDPATGGRVLQFEVPEGSSLMAIVAELGEVPLPPYITNTSTEPERYQTVYSTQLGAVAAPTAGLHFTPELLQTLADRGIHQATITLHVGVGTFRPVEAEDITTHQMHAEFAEIPIATVEQIRATQARGGRVIAVGTTAVRSLEAAAQSGTLEPWSGKTDLFIYPGYSWRVVDGLITNFHLPKSSLLMLVSALIGRSRLLDLYQVAIQQCYRFYSFGDAMLILPEAVTPTIAPH